MTSRLLFPTGSQPFHCSRMALGVTTVIVAFLLLSTHGNSLELEAPVAPKASEEAVCEVRNTKIEFEYQADVDLLFYHLYEISPLRRGTPERMTRELRMYARRPLLTNPCIFYDESTDTFLIAVKNWMQIAKYFRFPLLLSAAGRGASSVHDTFHLSEYFPPNNNTFECKSRPVTGYEDGRLFTVNGTLYATVNGHIRTATLGTPCNEERVIRPFIFPVRLANSRDWLPPRVPVPLQTVPESKNRLEKNWVPFVHNGQLYMSYSLVPHRVLRCDPETGLCPDAYQTSSEAAKHLLDLGRVSGGTPALRVSMFGGQDVYLAVLHTQNNRQYQHFAYTMSAEPPFEITRVSRELPLISASLNYVRIANTNVAFACGLAVRNGRVHVSYGVADSSSYLLTIPLKKLEECYFS